MLDDQEPKISCFSIISIKLGQCLYCLVFPASLILFYNLVCVCVWLCVCVCVCVCKCNSGILYSYTYLFHVCLSVCVSVFWYMHSYFKKKKHFSFSGARSTSFSHHLASASATWFAQSINKPQPEPQLISAYLIITDLNRLPRKC